jgi:hypothetical protein
LPIFLMWEGPSRPTVLPQKDITLIAQVPGGPTGAHGCQLVSYGRAHEGTRSCFCVVFFFCFVFVALLLSVLCREGLRCHPTPLNGLCCHPRGPTVAKKKSCPGGPTRAHGRQLVSYGRAHEGPRSCFLWSFLTLLLGRCH